MLDRLVGLVVNPFSPDVANHIINQVSQLLLKKTSPHTPLHYEANKSRNSDPKSYSYSTRLHTFTVTSSWVFSYFNVYDLWIPAHHIGLKGLRRPPREWKIPGSNPACAGIFSGSSHTSDSNIGTPVATLPGAWRYRVSTGTGRPGVSIL